MQTYGEIATTIMFTFPLDNFIVQQNNIQWAEKCNNWNILITCQDVKMALDDIVVGVGKFFGNLYY